MRLILILAAGLAVSGCATTPAPVCLGLVPMTPKVETSRHIVASDTAFALQVAGNNRTIRSNCK